MNWEDLSQYLFNFKSEFACYYLKKNLRFYLSKRLSKHFFKNLSRFCLILKTNSLPYCLVKNYINPKNLILIINHPFLSQKMAFKRWVFFVFVSLFVDTLCEAQEKEPLTGEKLLKYLKTKPDLWKVGFLKEF